MPPALLWSEDDDKHSEMCYVSLSIKCYACLLVDQEQMRLKRVDISSLINCQDSILCQGARFLYKLYLFQNVPLFFVGKQHRNISSTELFGKSTPVMFSVFKMVYQSYFQCWERHCRHEITEVHLPPTENEMPARREEIPCPTLSLFSSRKSSWCCRTSLAFS